MAYSVNWATRVVTIPLADLTLVSGSNYTLDASDVWIELRRLEAAPGDGLWTDQIAEFVNTQTLSGLPYSAILKMINGYTWDTDTTNKTISLLGINNNLLDTFIPGNGISVLANNSAGKITTGSGLSVEESLQVKETHGQVERSIYVDTSLVPVGNGYQQTPYNNWTDAVDDAEANGVRSLVLLADATVDRQLKTFNITGIGDPTLDVNGQILERCELRDLSVTGSIGGTSENHYHHCHMLAGLTGVSGDLHDCGFAGVVTLRAGSSTSIIDPYSNVAGLSRPTIDVNGGGCAVSIRGHKGGLIVAGADNAADEVTISMAMGRLQLAASNTAGTISCRGVCDFDDQSAGSTVETSGLVEDIIFTRLIEAGFTFEDLVRIIAAEAAGDVDEPVDGTYAIRDINDIKTRIAGVIGPNGGRNVTAVDGS